MNSEKSRIIKRWIKMNLVLLWVGIIIAVGTELSAGKMEGNNLPQLAQNTRSVGYPIAIIIPVAGLFTFSLMLLKLDEKT